MSAAHTPGPWVALIAGEGVEVNDGKGAQRNAIVHWTGFDATDRPLAERKANARLIAAAPRLVDACNGLLGLLQLIADHVPDDVREVLATSHRVIEASLAVAEATGEQSAETAIAKAIGSAA